MNPSASNPCTGTLKLSRPHHGLALAPVVAVVVDVRGDLVEVQVEHSDPGERLAHGHADHLVGGAHRYTN